MQYPPNSSNHVPVPFALREAVEKELDCLGVIKKAYNIVNGQPQLL